MFPAGTGPSVWPGRRGVTGKMTARTEVTKPNVVSVTMVTVHDTKLYDWTTRSCTVSVCYNDHTIRGFDICMVRCIHSVSCL